MLQKRTKEYTNDEVEILLDRLLNEVQVREVIPHRQTKNYVLKRIQDFRTTINNLDPEKIQAVGKKLSNIHNNPVGEVHRSKKYTYKKLYPLLKEIKKLILNDEQLRLCEVVESQFPNLIENGQEGIIVERIDETFGQLQYSKNSKLELRIGGLYQENNQLMMTNKVLKLLKEGSNDLYVCTLDKDPMRFDTESKKWVQTGVYLTATRDKNPSEDWFENIEKSIEKEGYSFHSVISLHSLLENENSCGYKIFKNIGEPNSFIFTFYYNSKNTTFSLKEDTDYLHQNSTDKEEQRNENITEMKRLKQLFQK